MSRVPARRVVASSIPASVAVVAVAIAVVFTWPIAVHARNRPPLSGPSSAVVVAVLVIGSLLLWLVPLLVVLWRRGVRRRHPTHVLWCWYIPVAAR